MRGSRRKRARRGVADFAPPQSLQIASKALRHSAEAGPRIGGFANLTQAACTPGSATNKTDCHPRSATGTSGTTGVGAGDWASGSFFNSTQQGACSSWELPQSSQQSGSSICASIRAARQTRIGPPAAGAESPTHRRSSSAMIWRIKPLFTAMKTIGQETIPGPCRASVRVICGFDGLDARRIGFPQRIEMVKITLKNYRESKDYGKIVTSVGRVLARQRHVSPIDVFADLKLLAADDLQRWKRGQVPYLERVIRCNLSRAGRILRILSFHAHDLNLKPSTTCYHHRKQPLRFSKSGEHLIEEAYSRHFVVVGNRNPFAEAKGVPGKRTESRARLRWWTGRTPKGRLSDGETLRDHCLRAGR